MAYEPQGLLPGRTNLADVFRFDIVLTFGAAAIAKTLGKDVLVVRNSPGNYTITFPQVYRKLCSIDLGMQIAAGTTLTPVVVTDNSGVASGTQAQGIFVNGGQIIFEIRTAAGAPTDPTAGDKAFLTFHLSRNFLNDKYEV